ncbi:MAG: hypothetical protein ACI4P0_00510, partial [Mailhella sp.]
MATKKSSFKDYMRRAAAEAAKSIEVPQDPPPAEEEIQEPIPVQPPAAEPAPPPQRREEEPVVVITASEQPSYLASSDPVEYSCASLGATAVLLLHYLIENKSRHINVSRVALYR